MIRRRHRSLLWLAASAFALLSACSDAGGEAPEPDQEAFCAHLGRAATMTFAFDRLDLESLRVLVPELEDAVAVAPLEIRSETQVLATSTRAVLDQWDEAEPLDVSAARDAFEDLEGDRDEVEEAGRALEAYARDECDLDLRHPPTSSTTAPPLPPTTDGATTTAPPSPTVTTGPPTTWTPAPTASLPPTANTTTTGVLIPAG